MSSPTSRACGASLLCHNFEMDADAIFSAAVEAEAGNYGAEYYPYGTAAAFAAKEDGKTVITVAISASRFQGQNFKCVQSILALLSRLTLA